MSLGAGRVEADSSNDARRRPTFVTLDLTHLLLTYQEVGEGLSRSLAARILARLALSRARWMPLAG
jgi:hypothetical protein